MGWNPVEDTRNFSGALMRQTQPEIVQQVWRSDFFNSSLNHTSPNISFTHNKLLLYRGFSKCWTSGKLTIWNMTLPHGLHLIHSVHYTQGIKISTAVIVPKNAELFKLVIKAWNLAWLLSSPRWIILDMESLWFRLLCWELSMPQNILWASCVKNCQCNEFE